MRLILRLVPVHFLHVDAVGVVAAVVGPAAVVRGRHGEVRVAVGVGPGERGRGQDLPAAQAALLVGTLLRG